MRLYSSILMLISLVLPLWSGGAVSYVPHIADPIMEPWRWQEIEDLSELGVLCVDEADDGALWFGCNGALVRYDGLTVDRMPFDEKLIAQIDTDPHRVPWGKSILCMDDGSVLSVVGIGLVQWIDGQWNVIVRNLGPTSFEVRLETAEDGSIWLLTSTALWRFSSDLSQRDVVLKATGAERLIAFCRNSIGDIWVARKTRRKSSDLIHIPLREGRPLEEPMWNSYPIGGDTAWMEAAVCEGPEGKIWYVDNSGKGGVKALDPQKGTWDSLQDVDVRKSYYSLMKDTEGTLWAGSSSGVLAIDGNGGRLYPSAQCGLPTVPLHIFQTLEGKWWVIGRGGYVYTMDPRHTRWLTYVNLHFECESKSGRQWYLMPSRDVVSYDPSTDTWLRYSQDDGLIEKVKSLYSSSHGLIWAVGHHENKAALGVFDGKQWNRMVIPEFASQFGNESIYEAADGTMWFGAAGDKLQSPKSTGGALQYEITPEGDVRLLNQYGPPEFPYHISKIEGTPDGSIWLGSVSLYQYEPASKRVQVIPELSGVFTLDMVVDQQQDLWVSKGLFGVYRKEEDGWRNFSTLDGLPGKYAVDLLPLSDGTLLAAIDKGISRFDGSRWAGAVFSEDFSMSSRGGKMRQSNDGSIWFNFTPHDARSPRVLMNLDPLKKFCSVRYRADAMAPDTHIASHPQEVDSTGNIYVSWSGQDSWNDTPADKLHFSWRINEGEWSSFTRDTGRTFLDLEDGMHTLEVRARDRDFNVDPSSAISGFTVVPSVWKRGWFVAMVVSFAGVSVAFVSLLFFFHEKRQKERQRHLVEMDQIKTGFFTNISHELNTPLALIKGALDQMRENEEERENLHDLAMRSVDRVSTLVAQILDFRKLEQGRIRIEPVEGDISAFMRDHINLLMPMAKRMQVSCEVVINDECIGWYDPDKLKKITSNLVGNAIKYTSEFGTVRVVLGERLNPEAGRELSLVIEDSGAGVEPEHMKRIFDRFYRIPEKSIVNGSGIGLNLTKELVDLWGGSIGAESPIYPSPEQPGTRFSVTLPIELEKIPNRGERHESSE